MKTWLIIAAAGLQFLVLAYMAGEREIVLLTGHTVFLRTAPVDPRDLFRGDYVTLNYEINTVRPDRVQDNLSVSKTDDRPKDMRVYTTLKESASGLATASGITDYRPADGLFIRGHLESGWGLTYRVRYGIEAFFVEQGKGRELEAKLSRTAEVQVPLEMEVKLAGNGLAVLKGYRWSPLGIGLTVDFDKDRRATGATVRLLNSSDKDLAIVDLPGNRSFTLDTDSTWSEDDKSWRWASADTPRPAVAAEHVRVLKPGEIHVVRFDFADAAWFITKTGEKPKPIGQVDEWQARFRLVYRPPAENEVRGLPNAAIIWHGELPSRAFNGGRVD